MLTYPKSTMGFRRTEDI